MKNALGQRNQRSLHDVIVAVANAIHRFCPERAVQLSRDIYCSVWSSMAPDIDLTVDLELEEPLLADGVAR